MNDEIAQAVAKLDPTEAAYFLNRLQGAIRKRKIQLWGYLTAIAMWAVTMGLALMYWVSTPRGTFVGWIFIIPFISVGVMLFLFGRWGDAVQQASQDDSINADAIAAKIKAKP
jgi:hypothetical protein